MDHFYECDECLFCYLHHYGNNRISSQRVDICFSCINHNFRVDRGWGHHNFSNRIAQVCANFFESVSCGCGALHAFGLHVPICEDCYNDFEDSWNILPRTQVCEYESCDKLVTTTTEECKVIDLCINCHSYVYYITDIEHRIPTDTKDSYIQIITDNIADDDVTYGVEIHCGCGAIEQKHSESSYYCARHYTIMYERCIFSLSFVDLIQSHNTGKDYIFYLPSEIWEIIRKYIVLML